MDVRSIPAPDNKEKDPKFGSFSLLIYPQNSSMPAFRDIDDLTVFKFIGYAHAPAASA